MQYVTDLRLNSLWEVLINRGLFTEDELQLATCLCGYSIDTLNDCIYCRYGYRPYEQMTDGEGFDA